MVQPVENAYDALPYMSMAFPQTHPDRLAVIARLFGMKTAPLANCRVLELGCASGGNLVPMALDLPEASFVGIDLSSRQIADGKATIAKAGLSNVELRQMDIMDVDKSLGTFDYIIAHGVFSWVPTHVQEQMFRICAQNLAPQGVAYISYNTYPGWHMRGMIRDMMRYHVKSFPDATVRVQQARAVLDFLAQSVPTENNAYGIVLKAELEMLRKQNDSYLAHEHLEDVNAPVYFHEFAERALARGLQFLGEAEFSTMLASNLPQQVSETLRKIAPDIVRMEQYMDFVRNRPFRQTLLVHQGVTLSRNLDWKTMQGFRIGSRAKPVSATPDIIGNAREEFRHPWGMSVVTGDPIVKAAFMILGECDPQTVPFEELCAKARARLDQHPQSTNDPAAKARDVELVGTEMLRCLAAAIVEVRIGPSREVAVVSERPQTSAVARAQAELGNTIANLRHEPIVLDEFNRNVVRLLDGRHDKAALIGDLAKLVDEKGMTIRRGDVPVTEPADVRAILEQVVPQSLEHLRKSAMLVA
jgi:methyltransferase-like protein/cyclopropane fatty-acyl-phospholipid synthase-like methyltransferase